MKKLAIGIMSGTSLDGIDVAIAEIDGSFLETILVPIAFDTIKYSDSLLKNIKSCLDIDSSSIDKICSLNFELAYAYADAVKKVCNKYNINLNDIDFIASHGQTMFHITENTDNLIKSTLQLGEGSVLSNILETTVVSNFRCADIANGGSGAPLVPYADFVLFRNEFVSRIMLNIGGISNVTVLPKGCTLDDVYAFDTGPGNMMMDFAVKEFFGKDYDENGEIARKGKLIKSLLDELMSNEYFKLNPPKSTGRELFGDNFTRMIIDKYQNKSKEDIVCTLTHFTASSIAKSYKKFIKKNTDIDEIFVSGGGAYNTYLLELLASYLGNMNVYTLEQMCFDSSSKEALAFIILGNETLQLNTSNVMNATGANKKAILGQINYFIK